MRRELALLVGLTLATMGVSASAQKPPASASAAPAPPSGSASAAPMAASPHNAGPIEEGAAMPPGHPAMPPQDDDDDDGQAAPTAASPHGAGGPPAQDAMGGEPPKDRVADDPTIPPGTVVVQAVDPLGKPLSKTEVTLGVLYNSVAKGESRKRVTQVADDTGSARFTGLDTGSGVAYRPMVLKDGATFSSTPFPLGPKTGIRVLLHIYPVTSDVEQTLIVTQSMIYVEVKDDRVQLQQAFRIYNFGKSAWVPQNYVVPLPENFTAFATDQGMSDVGVDAVEKKGIRIHGTFPPGQQVVDFRWQLPYSGEADVKVEIGMPAHLAAAKIIVPAAHNMKLDVAGFSPPQATTDAQGQHALVTEKQLRRDDPPMKNVTISISGLPTEGPGKIIATLLAFGALVFGIVLGARNPAPRDAKRERDHLFAALEQLEVGHRDGSIGPKTYQRARRDLIDDIARTFSVERGGAAPKARAKTKTKAA